MQVCTVIILNEVTCLVKRHLPFNFIFSIHPLWSVNHLFTRVNKNFFILITNEKGGDFNQWYKIMTEIDKGTWYAGTIIKAARSGHSERLCKEAKLKSEQRTNFLSNRVVNPWNKLEKISSAINHQLQKPCECKPQWLL